MQRHPETGLPLPSTPFTFGVTSTTDANSYAEVNKQTSDAPQHGFTFAHGETKTASAFPPFQFGGTFGLGNPLNKPKEKENTQSGETRETPKPSEQYRGACGGIHNPPNTTFPGVFQFGSKVDKVDNSRTVKALYDELSVIRTQIEHLTKATDKIYKIMSQFNESN
jgi:hypothetical protein